MRIAINTLPLYKTKVGMGRYIVELVNRIPILDKENTYFIYLSEKNQKFFTIKSENVVFKKVPKFFTLPFAKICWEQIILPFLLVKENINLYHAPGFVLPLIKQEKIKYVVTIADMTFFTHPKYHLQRKMWYFRAFIPSTLKKANKIITISENTKNNIVSLFPISPQKIVAIPLAADDMFTDKARVIAWQEKEILQKYNIKKPYLLFVGMLEPRKNITGILHAFEMLNEQDKKEITLVIVGKKGWMYDDIFRYVKVHNLENNVLFTGYVQDNELPALYKNAVCFLYPSFYEGFGIPVIEAMACGCPVITSNTSSLKEISGEAAILVEPSDTNAIKKAIIEIITNTKKRKELSIKGKRQTKQFNWQKMAKETKELYSVVLKNL